MRALGVRHYVLAAYALLHVGNDVGEVRAVLELESPKRTGDVARAAGVSKHRVIELLRCRLWCGGGSYLPAINDRFFVLRVCGRCRVPLVDQLDNWMSGRRRSIESLAHIFDVECTECRTLRAFNQRGRCVGERVI